MSAKKRIQKKQVKKPNTKLYEDFHGIKPVRARKAKLSVPKKGERLIVIGKLRELQYQPNPPSRRQGVRYSHEFGDYGKVQFGKNYPILATNEEGTELYIIKGRSKFKIGERGIVG